MLSSKPSWNIFLSCLFGTIFVLFSFFVRNGALLATDNYVNSNLILKMSSPLYLLSRGLAYFYIPLIIVFLILFYRFFRNNKTKESIIILIVLFFGATSEFIVKPVFMIPCPNTYYTNVLAGQEVFGLSSVLQSIGLAETCYPSSHVSAYVVFSGYLIHLTLKNIKRRRKSYFILVALFIVILLVGPSRVYLHVHWLSDVIGGYIFGFSLLFLLFAIKNFSISKGFTNRL